LYSNKSHHPLPLNAMLLMSDKHSSLLHFSKKDSKEKFYCTTSRVTTTRTLGLTTKYAFFVHSSEKGYWVHSLSYNSFLYFLSTPSLTILMALGHLVNLTFFLLFFCRYTTIVITVLLYYFGLYKIYLFINVKRINY
jgi:hypothetical protein